MTSNRLRATTLGLALGLSLALPLSADDTEIYVGNNLGGTAAKANMLVIIDTSGSMGSLMVTQADYDSAIAYPGCFDPTRVYWTTTSPPSSCGSSRWFDETYNTCEASAAALSSTGYFQDRLARFHRGAWRNLTTNSTTKRRSVECISDAGAHGPSDGDARVWAANQASGWSSNAGDQINWRNTGSNYTLFTGNFLNYLQSDPDVLRTRIDIIKDVIADLVDSTNSINIGLMRFDRNGEGGPVTYAMQDVEASRENFKAEMYTYHPSGTTPLAETLYEAALYHRAGEVDYGARSSPAHSAGEARQNGNASYYYSPIRYECQKNHIVLLTDGEPTRDTSADAKIAALPGFAEAVGAPACVNAHGDDDGKCLDELAAYLYRTDQADWLPGEQRVVTYTVGYATNQQLLSDTAEAGGGRYYVADDAVELTTAFANILTEILAQDATFAAPAVAVNAFNRTTHREELYFTLFKPDARPHWNGNLKKYRLGFETDPDTGESIARVLDANRNDAVDEATGFFKDSAVSYWRDPGEIADGSDVNKGGAAAELALPRRVYTFTGTGEPSNEALVTSANQLHEDNVALTEELLGLAPASTEPARDELLQWARGVDVNGAFGEPGGTRPVLGDPLHSRAAVVQYGGPQSDPDLTLFFTTNDGYLHATDEKDGDELFAFVPRELLANLKDLYLNEAGTPRPYGLDGSVSVWVNDENEDGVISGTDHVYVYAGMRRGGHSYYALDVTNRSAPRLLWRISNDPDGDGTPDGDYAELGQTWSEPAVRRIRLNGVDRTVLVFGGGYDPTQDGNVTTLPDVEGRAVYIADARTGERIWWAGPAGSGADLVLPEMTNSIPSAVNAIDIEGDGLIDRLYVGDMRAQVWRFDIEKDNNGSGDLATGGRIWSLGDASAPGNRRFYYPPDVALSGYPGLQPHLALVLGSGYRAHPLNATIEDRIYMLRDYDVFNAPSSYTTKTESHLFDATSNVIGEGTQTQRAAAREQLSDADGWLLELHDGSGAYVGEKVLASALILDGTAMVTTFDPSTDPADPAAPVSCAPRAGNGRVYYLDLADAQPVRNFDDIGPDSDLTARDRALTLRRGGIPPSPTLVIAPDDNAVLVGPEVVPDPTDGKAVRTYWHDT